MLNIPNETLDLFQEALAKLSAFFSGYKTSPQAQNSAPSAAVPPQTPQSPPPAPQPNPDALQSPWSDPVIAHHNVRALCDLEGITGTEQINGTHWLKKDILTACVYQESQFRINAKHENTVMEDTGEKDANAKPILVRKVASTDWGIVQINDYWHIGPGKDFPSVDYVLSNSELDVRYMCRYYKEHGHLNAWCSYSTGAFKQHLGKV